MSEEQLKAYLAKAKDETNLQGFIEPKIKRKGKLLSNW